MLTRFQKASDWVATSGGAVFPTFASFQWFVRKHRDELVGSRQYLPNHHATVHRGGLDPLLRFIHDTKMMTFELRI